MELIINNTSYPLIAAVPTGMGAEFDFRNAYLLTLEMDWQEAHEIFVDGLSWSLSVNGEISDKHDFTKAGQIIDYRNGTISAFMGEKTEAEKLEAENERILPIIQDLLPYLDDELAQEMLAYFPEWEADKDYEKGDRFRYLGSLYKARDNLTSVAHYPPDIAPTLYTRVGEPDEGGEDAPIPYEPNMELEEGKYYEQFGVVYYCNRSTGVPVYNNLADLVNLYVIVEG